MLILTLNQGDRLLVGARVVEVRRCTGDCAVLESRGARYEVRPYTPVTIGQCTISIQRVSPTRASVGFSAPGVKITRLT